MKKLFNVEVTFHTVILADSKDAAERKAARIIKQEDDTEPIECFANEIKAVKYLKHGWTGDCRPWGDRDDYDRTICEILEESTKKDVLNEKSNDELMYITLTGTNDEEKDMALEILKKRLVNNTKKE